MGKPTKSNQSSLCTALSVIALLATGSIYSPTVSAADACANSSWQEGKEYRRGGIISYQGKNYEVIQSHTAWAGTGWNPALVPALFKELSPCKGGESTPSPTPTPVLAVTPPPAPAPGSKAHGPDESDMDRMWEVVNRALPVANQVNPITPPTGGSDLTPQQVGQTFKTELDRASKASGIPPGVLAGMIWQESKGDVNVLGGGLLQLGDHEFQHYGGGNIRNPGDNIMAGAMYMKDLEKQFGNVPTALRAYNSGPNGVDRNNLHATPAGTGDPTYVDKVMGAAKASGLPS